MYYGIVHSNLPFFIQWLDSHVVKAGECKQMFSTCCHWNESAHGQLRNLEHCLEWWWWLVPSLLLSGYAYYSTPKNLVTRITWSSFQKHSTPKAMSSTTNLIISWKQRAQNFKHTGIDHVVFEYMPISHKRLWMESYQV